ncbi:MAG: hypothetical protein ACREPX_06220 [Rhodanobacteraceae bacterium]
MSNESSTFPPHRDSAQRAITACICSALALAVLLAAKTQAQGRNEIARSEPMVINVLAPNASTLCSPLPSRTIGYLVRGKFFYLLS